MYLFQGSCTLLLNQKLRYKYEQGYFLKVLLQILVYKIRSIHWEYPYFGNTFLPQKGFLEMLKKLIFEWQNIEVSACNSMYFKKGPAAPLNAYLYLQKWTQHQILLSACCVQYCVLWFEHVPMYCLLQVHPGQYFRYHFAQCSMYHYYPVGRQLSLHHLITLRNIETYLRKYII